MDTSKPSSVASFEETLLKAKVAQICDSVGYHAISQASSNILVDVYRRTIHHLARHCKDAANNNRRVEPTLLDLVQAYDFVGISIPELVEHIESVKLPLLDIVEQEEQEQPNRIQRNLLVDDLLEAKKNHLDDQEDGENRALSEIDDEEKPSVPLLKDAFEEIANKFTECSPVTASKNIRLGGRIVLVNNSHTKLKITAPVPPESIASTSGNENKVGKKKKKREIEKKSTSVSAHPVSPVKQNRGRGKKRKKISREFILPEPEPPIEPESPIPESTTSFEENKVKGRKRASAELQLDDSSIPVDVKPTTKVKKQGRKKHVSVKLESIVPEVPVETKPSTKVKGQTRKKRSSAELEPVAPEVPIDVKPLAKGKGQSKKKLKTAITPLDPSIAEPPSFFPILDIKVEEPETSSKVPLKTPTPTNTPTPPITAKQKGGKKRKRTKEQFKIVTETVSATDAEREWFCPACGGPDDGDVMVECDICKEWYHLGCTDLKKAPEDDENWACDICSSKAKEAQKKPQTPIEVIKTKTPEPAHIHVPTPPPAVVAGSSTQDVGDRCPECNQPDDGTMMIQCDDPFCAKWFHGKCVDLLEEPKEDESWFCKLCVDKQQSAFKRRRRAK